MRLLVELTRSPTKPQVIVFFNNKTELKETYDLIRRGNEVFSVNDPKAANEGKFNLTVDYIHGGVGNCVEGHAHSEDCMSKTDRMTMFRQGEVQVMLGTEAIGRGIDIRTVTLVVNFTEPREDRQPSPTAYIHRVGRTGRYTDQGIALTYLRDTSFIDMVKQRQGVDMLETSSETALFAMAAECVKHNLQTKGEHELRWKVG